ncbi:transcriptional regulator [Streptomyces chrestomyceticus JCM 4735]|uniref:Transcriptional regulator n=1 Tax=Streptomyces chrestomyceticus JCM 4735 TaxID=1306181 RepID=A0A7U9Q1N9_9ACTN|nr:transcriptional regulator [Streptomyces chrestomyceticus JCM 4735]
MPGSPGNPLLVRARISAGLHTQDDFVIAFQDKAFALGIDATVTVRQVRRWESLTPGWPHPTARTVLTALFGCPPESLGFRRRVRPLPPEASGTSPPSQAEGEMRRRTFVSHSLAVVGYAAIPTAPDDVLHVPVIDPLDAIRDVLTGTVSAREPGTIEALRRDTTEAKRLVQACGYARLARQLPALLARFGGSGSALPEQRATDLLAVHAYHVAATLLLKYDDAASAWIAAEKAAAAARRTEAPTAIASAYRILTHAVAAVGHRRQAVRVAITGVDRLSGRVSRSAPDNVAVFGALLLRGAWAAALGEDRDAAAELLDEAERTAALLQEATNRQWAAFGANNVALHRLSIALAFSDAGHALQAAKTVMPDQLAVAERQATYWTDVARALHACGRTEAATRALLAAEKAAPEEVRSRTVTRELIGELLQRDRAGRAPWLRALANRAQVPV